MRPQFYTHLVILAAIIYSTVASSYAAQNVKVEPTPTTNQIPDYGITFHPKFPHIPIPKNIYADGAVSVDAPLGHLQESPIVTVYINKKGPFHFMFDTGWSGAMISQRVAKQLNLPLIDSPKRKLVTPTQVMEVFQHRYLIHEMTLGHGKVKLEEYPIYTSSAFEDDAMMFKRKGSANEAGLDGVIGINTFYGFMVTIDYKHEKIIFEKNSLSKDNKDVLPYGKPSNIPNIDLTIHFSKLKRSIKQNFVLDTGSEYYIDVDACQIPEMHNFTGQEQLMKYDFTNTGHTTFLAKLYGGIEVFPNYTIQSPYITFSSKLCDRDPKGSLGRKFFDDHLVTIDPDDELVKVKKY